MNHHELVGGGWQNKTVIVLYHDQGQTWMWGEENRQALLPKAKGSGIILSDFIDEHDGNLCLSSNSIKPEL